MKKRLLCLTLCGMLLGSCGKQPLPAPEYPLDVATAEAAVAEAGLPWTVGEGKTWTQKSKIQELRLQDGRLVASFNSGKSDEGERLLNIGFLWESGGTAAVPEEEFETVITMAAKLYGEFKGEGRIYESLSKTDRAKTEVKIIPERRMDNLPERERLTWANEVDGMDCTIQFERWMDEEAGEPHVELYGIKISPAGYDWSKPLEIPPWADQIPSSSPAPH